MAYMERRGMVTGNPHVRDKEREIQYGGHVRALSAIRASIDLAPPRDYTHITRGGKKASLAEGAY